MAITAEIIYRYGGDDEFFDTPRHALITGSAIGLVGAVGWEFVEILLDYLFPTADIDHALPDTIFDVVLGMIGGPPEPGWRTATWTAFRPLPRKLPSPACSLARAATSYSQENRTVPMNDRECSTNGRWVRWHGSTSFERQTSGTRLLSAGETCRCPRLAGSQW